ncbi:SPT4 [Enterospora canceri]|uniref:Transcription elongation factor SPT4 n=1 Tax=Enterospora canceri TaxID=1081671 RepID=A0A1Y1S724_9MICR|nr:SPT4 [Enterospora canceri]
MAQAKPRNRACLSCGIIRSVEKFKTEGCPNCAFLQLGRGRNCDYCTSSSFRGQIYYTDVARSWVAKWQRNGGCVPGFYAMTVEGDLPDEFIARLEKSGIEYVSRNQEHEMQ